MDLKTVFDESRPMLTEFLQDSGIHREDSHLNLAALLEPFSHWIAEQTVEEDRRFDLASRLLAFICEFLIDHHSAVRTMEGNGILIGMSIAESVARDFDPHTLALSIFDGQISFADFISNLTIDTNNSV